MSHAEDDRLDSWKEIAKYIGRDVRTARRWEKERELPVHHVPGGDHGPVYAFRYEIDAWLRNGHPRTGPGDPPKSNVDVPQSRHEESHQTGPPSNDITNSSHSAKTLPAKRSATKSFPRIRIVASAAAIAAVILAIAIFIKFRSSPSDSSFLGSPSRVPFGIEHLLRISLVNGLSTAVASPFQQQIVVDSSVYANYESENLQNIEFFDGEGKRLRSWLESGNSNLSRHTVYWIDLPEGMPASKVVNLYMGFAKKDRNLFDATTTGEAPRLSPTYGEYDNGSNIFPHYADFAGAAYPPGWYSGFTQPGQGTVQVNHGITVSHKGRGGGTSFLGSDWRVGHNITEMDLLTERTVEGQAMIFVCSGSATRFRWTPNSIGYQNTSGLEIEVNNSGTPSVLAVAGINPTLPAVIGFQEGSLFADYQAVARIDSPICGGEYLAASMNTGFFVSFSFDWIRMRVPPPHGVMPTVILGEVQ